MGVEFAGYLYAIGMEVRWFKAKRQSSNEESKTPLIRCVYVMLCRTDGSYLVRDCEHCR